MLITAAAEPHPDENSYPKGLTEARLKLSERLHLWGFYVSNFLEGRNGLLLSVGGGVRATGEDGLTSVCSSAGCLRL